MSRRARLFSVTATIIMSLIYPGLGHIYARRWTRGLCLLAIAFAFGILFRCITRTISPVLVATLAFLCIGLVAIVFSVGCAFDAVRQLASRADRARPRWFQSTWAAALACVVAGVIVDRSVPQGWQSFNTPSSSNAPTLRVGDYFIADIRHPRALPARGAMVVFKPSGSHENWVKRVIGLPGDHVSLQAGELYINGEKVPRRQSGTTTDAASFGPSVPVLEYTETLPGGRMHGIWKTNDDGETNNTPDALVPEGAVFVLGDSRDNSIDSRFADRVGFVPLKNVVGTVSLIYWSRDRSRILQRIE